MAKLYPINTWINEQRYEWSKKAGLASLDKDILAGMKVIQLQCTQRSDWPAPKQPYIRQSPSQ